MKTERLYAAILLHLSLAGAVCAGEFVTKDEFNKFLEQYEKNQAENRQLKKQNEELATQVQALQAESKQAALDSKLDSFLTPDEAASKRNHEVQLARSGSTKFLMSGWADAGYEDRRGKNTTFTSSFHPVFLWKLDDRLSFESDLTYATIAYHFDDLGTLEAGKFLTPFGAFIRRQHQSWSNKLPDDPLALDINSGLAPSYTVGAMFSGGFAGPCTTRFNYAAYVGNGPRLSTGNPETIGVLDFNNDVDANKSKAYGGRMGFLPTADLEFGASFQTSRVGPERSLQTGVDASLFGADISYVNDFDALKGSVDFKFEWVWSRVDRAEYEFGGDRFFFQNNRCNGGYVQAAYRPSKVEQKWIRNFEFVLRYDRLDNPDQGPVISGVSRRQFVDHDRSTIGLNYWLGPTAVLKFGYERDRGQDRGILLQFALGF